MHPSVYADEPTCCNKGLPSVSAGEGLTSLTISSPESAFTKPSTEAMLRRPRPMASTTAQPCGTDTQARKHTSNEHTGTQPKVAMVKPAGERVGGKAGCGGLTLSSHTVSLASTGNETFQAGFKLQQHTSPGARDSHMWHMSAYGQKRSTRLPYNRGPSPAHLGCLYAGLWEDVCWWWRDKVPTAISAAADEGHRQGRHGALHSTTQHSMSKGHSQGIAAPNTEAVHVWIMSAQALLQ
jgi:hypothetical protein